MRGGEVRQEGDLPGQRFPLEGTQYFIKSYLETTEKNCLLTSYVAITKTQ